MFGPLFYIATPAWLLFSCYQAYNGTWFQYHPIFMNLSVFGGITFALWQEKQRSANKHSYVLGVLDSPGSIHMTLQIVSAALMSFAFYVIWTNKNIKDKPHFTSWHSWVGGAALALFLVQCVIGSFRMSPDKTPKQRESDKFAHTTFGLLLYVLLLVACLLGYAKHTDFSVMDERFWIFTGCFSVSTLLFATFTLGYGSNASAQQATAAKTK